MKKPTTVINLGLFKAESSLTIVCHRSLFGEETPNGGAVSILEIKNFPTGKPSGFVSCYYCCRNHDSFVVAAWQDLEHAVGAFDRDIKALCLRPDTLAGFLGKEELEEGEFPWFFHEVTYIPDET